MNFFKLFSLSFIILLAIGGVSASVVTGTGLPSASNDLPYKQFTVSFMDYCPLCGAHDCLLWNPKGTDEGEWTCSHCGADFCAVTGADKTYSPRASLVKVEDIKIFEILRSMKL